MKTIQWEKMKEGTSTYSIHTFLHIHLSAPAHTGAHTHNNTHTHAHTHACTHKRHDFHEKKFNVIYAIFSFQKESQH